MQVLFQATAIEQISQQSKVHEYFEYSQCVYVMCTLYWTLCNSIICFKCTNSNLKNNTVSAVCESLSVLKVSREMMGGRDS